MKKRFLWMTIVIFVMLLLTGCISRARVGELVTESQSVELGDARAARVEIDFGAGDLEVNGGAEKLLEADFTYNVARLKPEVAYAGGRLVVRQPEVSGMPVLQDINDFRNEWSLRLNDKTPVDLRINIGAGTSDLQLAGLLLTRLNVNLGAGISTVDLSGDWKDDLDVTIDTGLADITVRLPSDFGVRVEVDTGPTSVEASGLRQNGNVYTNDAYDVSEVTLQVHMKAGVGRITLEVDENTQAKAALKVSR